MLYIAKRLKDLDFRQLMDIYEEGNLENAAELWPEEPQGQQLLLAEQSFHQYLRECFFQRRGHFTAFGWKMTSMSAPCGWNPIRTVCFWRHWKRGPISAARAMLWNL